MTARLNVKHSSAPLVATTIFFVMLFTATRFTFADTIFQDDFNSYTSIKELTSSGGWDYVAPDTTLESSGCYSGKCIRISYSGEANKPVVKDVSSSNASELYVQFRFKYTGAGTGACKGLKLFGKGYDSTNATYANNTWNFGQVENTPMFVPALCYGNGSTLQNDTNVCLYSNGTINGNAGPVLFRSTSSLWYPSANTWYSLEFYQKYNSNGQQDGEYWFKVNGTMKMHVINVKNRNDANIREFLKVSLGDYSNKYANFDVYFDDITISTGSTTNSVSKAPSAPSKLQLN